MDVPEPQYARSGDVAIAYEVFGEGPIDLIVAQGFFSHLEANWEWPSFAHLFRRLGSFARVINFDKRGTGLSDPIEGAPTIEDRMEDIRAVMDAVGSEQAVLFGWSEGGPMSVVFAATYPERVRSLVLYSTFARVAWADDYPIGAPSETLGSFIDDLRSNWPMPSGAGKASLEVEELDHPGYTDWWIRHARLGASPRMAVAIMELNMQIDVRSVLAEVRVPTLVLHRAADWFIPVQWGRYVADHIPGAKYVELEGQQHAPFLGDVDALVDEVEEFVTGTRGHDVDRALASVLFTDIVASTAQATELGDRGWRELLDRHDEAVRREVLRFHGRVVKHTGDGALAVFDGPARGIRCARNLTDVARRLGLAIRAGMHTGECEIRGDDVGGFAVHLASRVAELADADEVLVTSTVKDLVIGSGIDFVDRGEHLVKGVPDEWRLYAASR